MKKTNLQKIADSLENMETVIELDEELRLKAEAALNKMLMIS